MSLPSIRIRAGGFELVHRSLNVPGTHHGHPKPDGGGVHQCDSGVTCLELCIPVAGIAVGRDAQPLDLGRDLGMVVLHLIEELARRGVQRPHQRPEAGVLSLVVPVQEVHHPDQVPAQGFPLRVIRWVSRGQSRRGPGQVTTQGRVDDAHHGGVRRCVRIGLHR